MDCRRNKLVSALAYRVRAERLERISAGCALMNGRWVTGIIYGSQKPGCRRSDHLSHCRPELICSHTGKTNSVILEHRGSCKFLPRLKERKCLPNRSERPRGCQHRAERLELTLESSGRLNL